MFSSTLTTGHKNKPFFTLNTPTGSVVVRFPISNSVDKSTVSVLTLNMLKAPKRSQGQDVKSRRPFYRTDQICFSCFGIGSPRHYSCEIMFFSVPRSVLYLHYWYMLWTLLDHTSSLKSSPQLTTAIPVPSSSFSWSVFN